MDIHGHNPDLDDPYRDLGMALARVISSEVHNAAGRAPELPETLPTSYAADESIEWPAAGVSLLVQTNTTASGIPDVSHESYDIFANDGATSRSPAEMVLKPDDTKGLPSKYELERMSPTELSLVQLPTADELERMSPADMALVEWLVHRRMRQAVAGKPELEYEDTPISPDAVSRPAGVYDIENETASHMVISAGGPAKSDTQELVEQPEASNPEQQMEASQPEKLRKRFRRGRKAAGTAIGLRVEKAVVAFDGLANPPTSLVEVPAPNAAMELSSAPERIAEDVTVLIDGLDAQTTAGSLEDRGDDPALTVEPVVVEDIPIVAAVLKIADRIPQPNRQGLEPKAAPAEQDTAGSDESPQERKRLQRIIRSKAGVIGMTVLLAAGAGIQQTADSIFSGDRPPAAVSDKPAPSLERLRELGVPSTPAGKWVPGEVLRFNEVISKLQNDQALKTYLESKGWQPWYIEPRLVQACVLVLSGGDLNFKSDDGRTGLTLVDEAWAREQMADYNPGDPSHALFALMLKLNERYVAAFETGKYTEPEDRKKLIQETIIGELKDQDPLDSNRQRLEMLAQWVPELDSQWLQDSAPAYDKFKESKANKK